MLAVSLAQGRFLDGWPAGSRAGVTGLSARTTLATRQDVRLGLRQPRLGASSCSAQELTALDTETPTARPRMP